jgi:hypothetical protein
VTARPVDGDYILSPTGYSWNVRRSNGDGTVQSVFEGERDKKVARAQVISRADTDKTDAWQSTSPGEFWLLKGFRS